MGLLRIPFKYCLRDENLGRLAHRKQSDIAASLDINIFGFVSAIMVSVTLAPTLIFVLELPFGYPANTFTMPKFQSKIYPFLVTVAFPCRRIKQLIHVGKGLVKQCN